MKHGPWKVSSPDGKLEAEFFQDQRHGVHIEYGWSRYENRPFSTTRWVHGELVGTLYGDCSCRVKGQGLGGGYRRCLRDVRRADTMRLADQINGRPVDIRFNPEFKSEEHYFTTKQYDTREKLRLAVHG